MVIERVKDEIIIKIPNSLDIDMIQQFIDYINFKSIQSKSEATEKDIEDLSKEINKSWIDKNIHRFIK